MSIAAVIKADVLAFAPELSTLTDQFWVDALDYVNQVDLTSVDTDIDRRLARIYLAAHIGSTTKRAGTGAAGPVTSESAGGIRRSYGLLATSASGSGLSSTRYGQLYESILSMSLAHGPLLI